MSIGVKIRQLRLQQGRTQGEISQLTGMAISYLSRLENGRINPSGRTLSRLSEALGVPVASFFDAEPVLENADRCPVSLSGDCILDQIFVTRGRPQKQRRETYTREQLEMLRLCNFLLHSRNRKIRTTLATLLRSLAEAVKKSET